MGYKFDARLLLTEPTQVLVIAAACGFVMLFIYHVGVIKTDLTTAIDKPLLSGRVWARKVAQVL